MTIGNTRKGFTQAQFNDSASSLLMGEIVVISALLGWANSSWYVFGGLFIGLIILFFIPGIIGLGVIFLWFFTDHTQTAGNFNIIWAFPAHLFVAFVVARKRGPNWVAKYALFSLGLIVASMFIWLVGLQIFSPLLMLVWLALAARYLFLFWSYKKPLLA